MTYRSELFAPTSREAGVSGTRTIRLLHRAGYLRDFGSGLWGFTPVGQRVRRQIADRVRAAFERVGSGAIALPALGGADVWRASGRWESFEGEMFTTEDRDGGRLCLSPSHEEAATRLLAGAVRSYADLPVIVHQVGRKFRDDHANDGLVRTKEFTMADAYSFHADRDSARETYRAMRETIADTLAGLGLQFAVVPAETGVMGGSRSAEFVAPVAEGGDRLRWCSADGCRFGRTDEHDGFRSVAAGDACPDCGGRVVETRGIEIAHVFRLGTRYAEAADLRIDTADGGTRHVEMGSYGVGVDRLLQTLVRQHVFGTGVGTATDATSDAVEAGDTGDAASGSADTDDTLATERGVAFPVTARGCVAPFRASVIPVGDDETVRAAVATIHETCDDVLVYDEDRAVGERFAESDLLGIPAKLVVGNRYREEGLIDLETRDGETRGIDPGEVADALARFG